jgi:hypothetical protein
MAGLAVVSTRPTASLCRVMIAYSCIFLLLELLRTSSDPNPFRMREIMIRCSSRRTISTDHIFTDSERNRT